jgi:hypothetical protein
MTEDFFEGFFAALRLRQQEFVETRDNVHHERFRAASERLEQAQHDHLAGSAELPKMFRPMMATGLYSELDDALLGLQQGFGSSPNPSYPGLKLTITEQQAEDVLLDFSADARVLLDRLAEAFICAKLDNRRSGVAQPV